MLEAFFNEYIYHTRFISWEDEGFYNVFTSVDRRSSREERPWQSNGTDVRGINNGSNRLFPWLRRKTWQ